jgi:hypothetical protein
MPGSLRKKLTTTSEGQMDLDLIVIGDGTAGTNPRRRLIIGGAIFDIMAV